MEELNLFTKKPTEKQPVVFPVPDEDTPPEIPEINISNQIIEETFEFVEDVIDVAEDLVPDDSDFRPPINWFRRKLMWAKRKYKQYKVWSHKLGRIEMDPKIRSESRSQRQQISKLKKEITVLDLDARLSKLESQMLSQESKTSLMR